MELQRAMIFIQSSTIIDTNPVPVPMVSVGRKYVRVAENYFNAHRGEV